MKHLYAKVAAKIPMHHAYHLVGDREQAEQLVRTFIHDALEVRTEGNPDVLILRYVALSVNDARELKELAGKKPLSGAQYFIISFQFATTEAQNALLKLFEEPSAHTHFFIITPSVGTLLSTVRSRVERLESYFAEKNGGIARTFFDSSPKQRMALMKDVVEEKNKEELLAVIGDLEYVVHAALNTKTMDAWQESAEALVTARRYLHGKAASVKMIAEYLAAVLPKVSL